MRLPILPPDNILVTPADGRCTNAWSLFFDSTVRWLRNNGGTVYSTHAQRTDPSARGYISPGSVAEGTLYAESDRTVIYEMRSGVWIWACGAMGGLLAARPVDLGTNDTGFIYNSTDALDYRWGGAAWTALGTVRGGAALADVNRIPKITAAGILGESSISDDGTKVSSTEPADITGAIRALSTAAAAAAAGKGVEIRYASGVDAGEILAYDRSGAAYKNLALNALLLLLDISGTEIARVTATGLDVTGAGAVYKIGGASGITGGLSLALTTQVVNYKDHASVNQTVTVVTNVTITANAFTGGIRTT